MDMGMMFGSVHADTRSRTIYDRSGTAVGSMSYSRRSGKPEKSKKRLPYRYKEISALILRSKTSGTAGQAVIRARAMAASLRKKLRTGEYDDQELEDAIIHADKMVRIAKKRQKHLKEEENAKRLSSQEEEFNQDEEFDEDLQAALDGLEQEDGAALEEEEMRQYLKELQKQMQEQIKEMQEQMQEEMQDMMREFGSEDGLEELSEELGQMDKLVTKPRDLEELKRKHRQEEMRDIILADMEYLKAFFGRLEKERQQASNGGVSLELGGMDIPVETTQAPPLMVEAVSIDETV